MNKRLGIIIAFILAFCTAIGIKAQESKDVSRLSFKIIDKNGRHPLSSANCRVYTKEGELYSFGISDNNGRLTVKAGRTDRLEFSFMGYAARKMEAGFFADNRVNLIELEETLVELREITIKAPPIRRKNDTVSYHVRSFVKSGDVHLEDVLKKLPGIKVAENGVVSYQGKAINKFYIEGKDLLGSSYNQATRNMPVDAVTTVEVMENHQPVRMLQGRKFTDNAALNIKIDRSYKSKPFGEVSGGLGGSPAIWNNSLFLTQIFNKNQLLVTGKMNNTGTDISTETKEHIDITDLDAYEPLMSALLTPVTYAETLPTNRYLRNKSFSTGINHLTSLSPDATLRLNVLMYSDRSSYTSSHSYIYGGMNAVNLTEVHDAGQKTLTVLPIVKYELNNDKMYVSDEFRYSFNRIETANRLNANGTGILESSGNRPSYFQNYFSSAFHLGKNVVEIKSLLRYFNRKEVLEDVADSISLYNLVERFATESFVAKNILSTSFSLFRNNLKLTSKFYYRNNVYDYDGRVKNRRLLFVLAPDYDISFGTERVLSVSIPVEWNSLTDGEDGRSLFSFSPSVYFKYRFTDCWKLVLSASVSNDHTLADFYSPYRLRTGYRTQYLPENGAYMNRYKRLAARLNYSDLSTMFFSNISVSYADEKKECYTDYHYTDSLTTVSLLKGDNDGMTLAVNASVDKSFVNAGISVKSEMGYNRMHYLLSQSEVQTYNLSNVFHTRLILMYQKLDWIRVTLEAIGNFYWEHNDFSSSDPLKSLVCNSSVFIFPSRKIDLKLKYYHYLNEISPSSYKNCGIFDFNANFKLGKKWETGVSVTNLFDTEHYVVTRETGINRFRTVLPLRGREFLFKILWRI